MKTLKGIKDQITLTVDVELMADMGKTETLDLQLTIKKINDVESVKQLFRDFEEGKRDELQTMQDHIVDWDLTYDDDTQVELTAETLAEVWQIPPYRNALVQAFSTVQLGYQALQSKNS